MLDLSNTQKVLEIIFKFPTKGLSIREIARLTKLSPPTVSIIVKRLKRLEILEVIKEKANYKVVGNFDNDYFKDLKRVYNIFSLIELKHLLVREFRPNLIVVFGSYSFGEDVENSDVDIFIETTVEKDIRLEKIEKKLNRKIHLIKGEFKGLPEELKKNIVNGIVLWGAI